MIPQAARLVFLKDARELLRDRRALFVNLVLPVLLYPVLALFMAQALQFTAAHRPDPPLVAFIDCPEGIDRRLPPAASATGARVLALPATAAAALRIAAGAKDHAPALAILRAYGLTAAVVAGGAIGTPVRLAIDNAHPQAMQARMALEGVLEQEGRAQVAAALAAARLPPGLADPFPTQVVDCAPPAEAVRTHLAGIIPLLLVVLAASSAFVAAADLVAGERERGTLETLLAWPARRRDLFLGKLLVVVAFAFASVLLNLLSLAFTTALIGTQLQAAGMDPGAMLAAGLPALALCAAVVLPLAIAIGATALAVAGVAQSAREAQNSLGPLVLLLTLLATVAALPDARPAFALDLVPVTGAVLALKEGLQSAHMPWLHLAMSGLTSCCLAAVLVAWSARRWDDESFRYPGLVRAGWGRWRKWGRGPDAPGGLEVLAMYAVAAGGFVLGAGLFRDVHPALRVAGPLVAFALLPAVALTWLGAYRPAASLHLARPRASQVLAGLALVPLAAALSFAIGSLQPAPPPEMEREIGAVFKALEAAGGLPLVLICAALAPAVCEELLCRGALLAGLRRGIGPVGAVLVSAFLFAALHGSPFRLLPQAALGVLLAVLVLRSSSVWPAMALHFGHNAVVVLLATHGEQLQQRLMNSGKLDPIGWTLIGLAVLAGLGGAALAWRWSRKAPG